MMVVQRLNAYTALSWWQYALVLALCTFTLVTQAQDNQAASSAKVDQLVGKADELLRQREFDRAIVILKETATLSRKISYLSGEAISNQHLGEAYAQKKEYTEALKHYFTALKNYEILKDDQKMIAIHGAVGSLYQQENAHAQAIRYFEQAYKKLGDSNGNAASRLTLLENIAYSYKQLANYSQAIQYKTKVLNEYKQQGNAAKVREAYQELAALSEFSTNYRQAQQYNTALVEDYEKSNDIAGLSTAYNNLGFVYKRTNDIKSSSDYFNKAIALLDKQSKNVNESDRATVYLNAGVAYTNLKSYIKAKENYLEALRIREKQKNEVEIANINNYLAGSYYVSGNTSRALKAVTNAIKTGEANNAEEVLVTSYQILALIYEKDNNASKAKFYQEKHKALKDKLAKIESARKQLILQRQLEIEKEEEEIRALLSEQEREALESERKESEILLQEKEIKLRANELAILKRDQQLRTIEYRNQQLEKERTEQALALAQQQLQAEKKGREVELLEKEKELQKQNMKRKALEEEQQKKVIQLLEADKTLKDEQLKYGYWIFGLFALVLCVIIYSFLQKRKANKLLERQQDEIKVKNNELLQSMSELQSAQSILSNQNVQLGIQHTKITSSMEYAQRIQSSILPSENLRHRLFPNHFITYLPKDIVSGDFYWMAAHGNKKILSVVDCTGHGVPGALMSMVGSTTLNELIIQKNITDPAHILNYLHEGIREKLSQEESRNNDGMDLGICVLEPHENGSTKVVFAGAKQTLYVIKDGELIDLEGDRKSIGGANAGASRNFSNKEIELNSGDLLYLTTDGFIDQNNADRVRFNKSRFRDLIREVHDKSTLEQKKSFEEALAAHQQGTEQRDDITVVAVKL